MPGNGDEGAQHLPASVRGARRDPPIRYGSQGKRSHRRRAPHPERWEYDRNLIYTSRSGPIANPSVHSPFRWGIIRGTLIPPTASPLSAATTPVPPRTGRHGSQPTTCPNLRLRTLVSRK